MAEPRQEQQGAAPAAGQPQELTEHEAAIYDRQLRVWGVETQKRRAITCRHAMRHCRHAAHRPSPADQMHVALHPAG